MLRPTVDGSPVEMVIPPSLKACLVGPVTASEIGWLKH